MGKNILFINNTGNAAAIPALLATNGYVLDEAAGPETGLRRLLEREYQVIISLENPAAESWRLCEQIRRFTGTPLIVISPEAGTEACIKAINAGADYFLRKRFGPLELLARIGSLLQRAPPRPTVSVTP